MALAVVNPALGTFFLLPTPKRTPRIETGESETRKPQVTQRKEADTTYIRSGLLYRSFRLRGRYSHRYVSLQEDMAEESADEVVVSMNAGFWMIAVSRLALSLI
jgi:hypothetical protein